MNTEIDGKSLDVKSQKLRQLKQLFPEFFSEDNLDLARVKELLSDEEIAAPDHYELSWAGKAQARKEIQRQTTATLIPDLDGSINFHTSENVFIEGENLEVLRILQKSYFSKVKMIYIDPPYNTGNDSFVYPDDYSERKKEYEKRTGLKNDDGYLNKLDLYKKNSKENGQYHSVWLSMMYPRLYLARNLLKEDGVIFVSIDDNEAANLKLLMDEVFGAENFRNTFAIRRYDKNLNLQFIEQGLKTFNVGFEYIFCYAKSEKFNFNPVYKKSSEDRQKFGYWKGFWNDADRKTMRYKLLGFTPTEGQWKWKAERALKAVENYKTYTEQYSFKMSIEDYWIETGKKLHFIRRNPNGQGKNKGVEHWIPPSEGSLRNTNWIDLFASKDEKEVSGLIEFPKNIEVLKNLVGASSSDDDIILDFFAGSCSTAHAVLELNREEGISRQFICVQMPEVVNEDTEAYKAGYRTIADVGKARIQKVVEKLRKGSNGKFNDGETGQGLGFKSYKIWHSNFRKWNSDIANKDELLKQLEIFKEPLENRPEDSYCLLIELLLKAGFPLSAKVEQRESKDRLPYFIVENDQVAFALDGLSDQLLTEVERIKPESFITLGNLFIGEKADELMTNWKLQLKESDIQFKII